MLGPCIVASIVASMTPNVFASISSQKEHKNSIAVNISYQFAKWRYVQGISLVSSELDQIFYIFCSIKESHKLFYKDLNECMMQLKLSCKEIMVTLSRLEARLETTTENREFYTEHASFIDEKLELCRLYMQIVQMCIDGV